jgi:uncharacterized protein YhaN
MKLLRFDLLAFGPFADVSINLEEGNYGLHVIYGLNEAGKSSALHGLRQLFFGIDERTADGFLHGYDRLRLGAKLRHSDGTLLEFIRRKGRKNDLRASDDRTVLEPEMLARFLGGLEQRAFERVFGIDHVALRTGGDEIVQGQGEPGQALFAAGAGIAGLRAVQDGLQQELEELFKPAGRKQRINAALVELRDARDEVRRLQLSSDDWQRHKNAQDEAERKKREQETEIQELRRRQQRLQRLRDALPAIAERKQILVDFHDLRSAPRLPAEFGNKRHAAQAAQTLARDRLERAKRQLKEVTRRLGELDVPESLLQRAGDIKDIHRLLGEYQKAALDRPRNELLAKTVEHEAKEILRSLRREPDLERVDDLRLGADEPPRIQELGGKQERLGGRLSTALETVGDLNTELEQAREVLQRLAAPIDSAELRQAVRQVDLQGPLEEELLTLQNKLHSDEAQAALQLKRLPLWSGALEELERAPVPTVETVDHCAEEGKEAGQSAQKLQDGLHDAEKQLRELDKQLHQLELQRDVPTENDLDAARQRRDAGWRVVRQAWLEDSVDSATERSFVEEFAPAADLPSAYELSVTRVDDVADRLRREAERVARKAELLAESQKQEACRNDLLQRSNQAAAEHQRRQEEWSAMWRPAGMEPRSPAEMRGWLKQHADLLCLAGDLRLQRNHLQLLQGTISAARTFLGGCLERIGLAAPPAATSLSLLIAHCHAVVLREEERERNRSQQQNNIARLERELASAREKVRTASEELETCKEQWATAVARIGLGANATPSAANAFLTQIQQLFQKLREAQGFHKRNEGIDRDLEKITQQVHAVAQATVPDLVTATVETCVEALQARLHQAQQAEATQQTFLHQQENWQREAEGAEEELAQAGAELVTLCREAACQTENELPYAEERSARRAKLEDDVHRNEEHLRSLSGGMTVNAFAAEADAIDADALPGEIDRLDRQIRDLEKQLSGLDQTIGEERKALADMGGSSAAADKAAVVHGLLAQVHEDARRYAQLRLAAYVLQQGINAFRAKNQGPFLERASRYFHALTDGSFVELQIDYDDHDTPFLVAVRGGNRAQLPVNALSDGTRDQLYLALRLAFLEGYLASNEPIPFIFDDILLNFDDPRAAATLRVLGDFSKKTQVILFTHHAHIVVLAREHVSDKVLFVHDKELATTRN